MFYYDAGEHFFLNINYFIQPRWLHTAVKKKTEISPDLHHACAE